MDTYENFLEDAHDGRNGEYEQWQRMVEENWQPTPLPDPTATPRTLTHVRGGATMTSEQMQELWKRLTDAARTMLIEAAVMGEVQVETIGQWGTALALKRAFMLRPKDGTLAFSAWVLTAGGSAVVNENTESEKRAG